MWTLLFIAAVVLITFRMFVRHQEDRDLVPFEATLTDEDRARLHRLPVLWIGNDDLKIKYSSFVELTTDRARFCEF
jgi:hypothetical protein